MENLKSGFARRTFLSGAALAPLAVSAEAKGKRAAAADAATKRQWWSYQFEIVELERSEEKPA